jgi:3-hydroxymyristoyl/3-hydroxydecanoyl-(acyl carrier protein) dehydratase
VSDHFAAFSFVDRITDFVPGARARGRFSVPGDLAAFPSCLVAEAVGQLAAWAAMAHIGFRGRPVAALANETLFAGDVAPGEVLELAVEIESCDDDAVAYAGSARCGERKVIDLIDCLGPMLPVEEFDSPAAMAERLALLRGPGATPGRFHGIALPPLVPGPGVRGESATATLHVPTAAPFFADHFPRRAVFPATLLLDAQIGMALVLAAETARCAAGSRPVPVRMTHVKMRSFIAPGDVLELAARTAPSDNANAKIMLSAQTNGRTVATARLEFTAKARA